MEPEVYERMYQYKEKYWWFVAQRYLLGRIIRRFFTPGQNIKIIDVGCGPGVMLRALKAFGWTVGLDRSERALAYCLRDKDKPLCRGSVMAIPFKVDIFDLAVLGDVLYHKDVTDDDLVIQEVLRVLKPGGVAIFHEPAFALLFRNHDIAEHSARRYTASEIRKKVESAGFCVKDVFYANNLLVLPVFLVKVFEYLFKPAALPRSDLITVHPLFNRILTCIALGEVRFVTHVRLPVGVSVVCVAFKEGG